MLNESFECHFESVRPVPKAEIDFGNGRRLTRTLKGNIATYLCFGNGEVFDIIPGLSSPDECMRRLDRARALFAEASVANNPFEIVGTHHRSLVESSGEASMLDPSKWNFDSKMAVEEPILESFASRTLSTNRPEPKPIAPDLRKSAVEQPVLNGIDSRRAARLLREEDAYNQAVRDPMVHGFLSAGRSTVAAMSSWVFATILDVPLDDPYLGLAPYVLGGEGGRH